MRLVERAGHLLDAGAGQGKCPGLLLERLRAGPGRQRPGAGGGGAGEVEHPGRVGAVGSLGLAEQDIGVHGAVAGQRRPLLRLVVPVRDGRGGGAGVSVEPGGQLGAPGAEDQQLAPQTRGGSAGGGVDCREDAQHGGQRLVRAGQPVGAGGVVQRGPQVAEEFALAVAPGAVGGGGEVVQGVKVEHRGGARQTQERPSAHVALLQLSSAPARAPPGGPGGPSEAEVLKRAAEHRLQDAPGVAVGPGRLARLPPPHLPHRDPGLLAQLAGRLVVRGGEVLLGVPAALDAGGDDAPIGDGMFGHGHPRNPGPPR